MPISRIKHSTAGKQYTETLFYGVLKMTAHLRSQGIFLTQNEWEGYSEKWG